MIHVDLAENPQLPSRFRESKNGNGISVNVAQPAHVRLGLYIEKGAVDMDIVSLPLQPKSAYPCDSP
ncbi:MAG TPA: hypothetical protein VIS96_12745 [Terrimicrobiaceae bacterium]